jgi:hypothetical protein
MKVCFDVHGRNESELLDAAKNVLDTFTGGQPRRWHIDVEAHEEERAVGGLILVWRGEVVAEHDDREVP